MAYPIGSGNGPSPSRRGQGGRPSGTAVVLAVATSAAVICAGAVGAFSAPLAGLAALAACLIAAVSARHARLLAEPLRPLEGGSRGPLVIRAPRAAEAAGRGDSRSDAA